MAEARRITGGMNGENGRICVWGVSPEPFLIAYRPDVAKRMIDADKSLPGWLRRMASRDEFEVAA